MQYYQQQNDNILKLLIIGNSGVGKSCMLMRYVQNNFTTAFYNTIGVDFKMKNTEVDGKKIKIQIWDTAGQDRFRTITSTYYKGAHGIMLTYDVSDRQSFDSLNFWMEEIQKYAREHVDKIIVGNKCDRIQKRKVSYDEGFLYAKQCGLEYVQVSALSSSNISQAFEILVRKILKRTGPSSKDRKSLPPQYKTKKLNNKKQVKDQHCCY